MSPPFLAQSMILAQNAAELADACGADPSVYCSWVFDATGSTLLSTAAGRILPAAIRILVIVLIAFVLTRLSRSLIRRSVNRAAIEGRDALRALRRRARPTGGTEEGDEAVADVAVAARATQRAETIAGVIGSLVAFALWTVALAMILSDFGINVGPLIAGAGIVGVALGFGAQSLVADFLSGVFMLLEDQYGIGDVVNVGEATGTVEGISLRVTRLRDVEGTVWHVPNGQIRRVGNMSQLWSRSLLDIGVAYDTDLDQASRVITEVADGLADDPAWAAELLERPDLWGVQQFGPSEVVLRLVMKVRPASQWKVNREFRRRLKDAFDVEGIEIPFPQRTIWVRQGEAAGVPEAAFGGPSE